MSRIDDCDIDDTRSFLLSCALTNNVNQALKGKKGQRFLREMETALLAMPDKCLGEGTLIDEPVLLAEGCEIVGEACALGAVLIRRKVDSGLSELEAYREVKKSIPKPKDDEEYESGWKMIRKAAKLCGISQALAYGIVYANDEGGRYREHRETPEERYERVLKWVQDRIYRYSGWIRYRTGWVDGRPPWREDFW